MALKKAKLIKKEYLNSSVVKLVFSKDEGLQIKAGQYISIKIDDQGNFPCFRAYSIAGFKDNSFELLIKIVEDGRGSNWLKNIKEEIEIQFLGPIGDFNIKNPNNNHFFIATGTGIAPLKSMIEELLEKNDNQIKLLFGVRNMENLFLEEYFSKLEKQYKNFSFTMTLSRPEEKWTGEKGRVTEILEEIDIENTDNTDFYICGLKAMIEDVKKILIEKEVKSENIYFEKFD